MRALVYSRYGARPDLIDVPEPECPRDGAVVGVRATGVCRSDWHAWRGHDPVALPNIGGHEFAGVVTRLGAEVTGFAVGDRVTAPFVNGCGECRYCRAGQAQVCPEQTQPGFTHPGSFADFVVVRQADFNLVRLPDAIGFVTAAALGCRFATSYHALVAQARLAADEWLLLLGCGGAGLAAVLVAKSLGAKVVAVDPSAPARESARQLGADVVLSSAEPDELAAITASGADVSLDAYGSAATAQLGVRSLRRRGRHVQVGLMLGEAATAGLPWDLVVARELQVLGAHGMAAADYPELLARIASGSLDPAPLVGRVVSLAEAAAELAAFDHAPATAGIAVVEP